MAIVRTGGFHSQCCCAACRQPGLCSGLTRYCAHLGLPALWQTARAAAEFLLDIRYKVLQVSHTCSKVLAALGAEDVTVQHTMYFQRDFPVPYDIVVENIGDQSHVPFAHHGVAGNR